MSTHSGTVHKIGLLAASVIGINAMVGVGIVTIPTMLSSKVGPAGILTYVFSIALIVAFGFALGRVAWLNPGEAWTYRYPAKWAGHMVGMLSAWAYVIGVLVAMGFLIQQVGIWMQRFIPFLSPIILGLIIILVLMGLVLAGTEVSEIGQYVIAFFVIVPLLLTAFVCWLHFNPALLHPFMPQGIGSVFSTAPKVLFAFFGFESIVSLYAIVKEPQKNVPRAFLISIFVVGALYMFFSGGVLSSIHTTYFSKGLSTTLSHILEAAFPQYGFVAVAVLIGALFGMIGTLHSMLWSTSALLNDVLHKVKNPLIKTMMDKRIWNFHVSVVVATSIMIISALLFHAEALVDLTSFLLVFPTVFSIFGLLLIPEEWKSGRNIVTVIALLGGCTMIYFAGISFLRHLI